MDATQHLFPLTLCFTFYFYFTDWLYCGSPPSPRHRGVALRSVRAPYVRAGQERGRKPHATRRGYLYLPIQGIWAMDDTSPVPRTHVCEAWCEVGACVGSGRLGVISDSNWCVF
jgi:hypothetical protein